MSKQGVSSPQAIRTKGPSHGQEAAVVTAICLSWHTTSTSPLGDLCNMDNQSSDGLLKSATAVELSPQDANMVRLAPDRCLACSWNRVGCTSYSWTHHRQHARIWVTVCPMIHIGCTSSEPTSSHACSSCHDNSWAPCKARRVKRQEHSQTAPAAIQRREV